MLLPALLLPLSKLNSSDNYTMRSYPGSPTPCSTLFALPLILMTKRVETIGWASLPTRQHSRGSLQGSASPGFQTANITAITNAPLDGHKAFQPHRKEWRGNQLALKEVAGMEPGGVHLSNQTVQELYYFRYQRFTSQASAALSPLAPHKDCLTLYNVLYSKAWK